MTVAGICLREHEGEVQVLLVCSSKGKRTYPKGHIDGDEPGWYAAGRETYEEAGYYCTPERDPLGGYWAKNDESVTAFLLLRPERAGKQPENGRDPLWLPLPAAKAMLMADHGELIGMPMCSLLDAAAARFQEQCA